MAPNQKTTQPKGPKTNCFLACFGFGFDPKAHSSKKKLKKIDARKKFFKLKLCWPKLKVITTKKKSEFCYDAKAASLATSDDIVYEATKVHQLKRTDHHHVSIIKELKAPSFRDSVRQDIQSHTSQTCYATCHKDSVIGVAIMVAMLSIISIWGRLCAIICVSAWLYCIPLLQGNTDVTYTPTTTKLGADNLNKESYKKKVVLQGLIHRDSNAIGIS